MKGYKTVIIQVLIVVGFFSCGLAAGVYNFFPVPQILSFKHYFEYSQGTFEQRGQSENSSLPVETLNTFSQRLLVKKIKIPNFNGYGGGISYSGNILYIITNKGSIQTYDLKNYRLVNNEISDVPLNFSKFILSGHPYKNNFSLPRFRVNGVYAEYVNNEIHLLFVSHNAYDAENDCITHNLSRIELNINSDGPISSNKKWETIFTASPCIFPKPGNSWNTKSYEGHISGGSITEFDKNSLLISIGDYDNNGIKMNAEYAMDPSIPYGKFLTIDKQTGDWSIFASGSRNATGIYKDKNSVIWSVENGPKGGDELNILIKGENYGWPKVSYGIWYDLTLDLPGNQKKGTHPNYTKPVFSWVPAIAPSNITRIEGDKFNYWKGDLLMTTMHAKSIFRLRIDEQNRVIYEEKIQLDHRIRDLITLPDNKIVLISDDGYLIIIEDGGSIFENIDAEIKERANELTKFEQLINNSSDSNKKIVPENENSGQMIFQRYCSTCHNLNQTNQIGPHLNNLFQRKIGDLDNYVYSGKLANEDRTWNAQLLRSFLENPDKEFPGNRMQEVILTKSEIDSLINFFNQKNKN